MKYYSDVLEKLFNTEDELIVAEEEYQEKVRKAEEKRAAEREERKVLAEAIRADYEELKELYKVYCDKRSEIAKKYSTNFFRVLF